MHHVADPVRPHGGAADLGVLDEHQAARRVRGAGELRPYLLDIPAAVGLGRDAPGALRLLQRRVRDPQPACHLALRGYVARLRDSDHDVIEIPET
jgi:hypothetical protein